MNGLETLRFAFVALRAHRGRSILSALGIAIGIVAVTLLTAIGEGLHQMLLSEFTQFGTRLVVVTPGHTTTTGRPGAIVNNVRPLTVADAEALRQVPGVSAVVPVVTGNAEVEAGGRGRRALVNGVGHEMLAVWQVRMAGGRFLPADDPRAPRALAVLGARMARELFPGGNALGQRVRVGGQRYRIIGVTEPKGQFVGVDLDDTIYVPAALAMRLFDRESLVQVDLHYDEGTDPARIEAGARQVLLQRHGDEDFSVRSQEQMLSVLDTVLGVVTIAVALLGGISLLVGAVGIVTVLTIAVQERTPEIGLLRAVGASRGHVSRLFLIEAAGLSLLGGLAGLATGLSIVAGARLLMPELPARAAWDYVGAALLATVAIGLVAGIAPALQAARIEPVSALRVGEENA